MIAYRLRRTIRLGMRSLALHKLRSILTALGIIFGVASVIAMLSIGEGANYEAQEEIKKLGSRNIILKSVKPAAEGKSGTMISAMVQYGLTWKDYAQMGATVPTIDARVPMKIVPTDGRRYRERLDLKLVGTTPLYLELGNIQLARGRFLCDNDIDTGRAVAVLGADVAKTLFPVHDPLGEKILLDQYYFRVIGVLRATGSSSGTGAVEADDRNKIVVVPHTTLRKRLGDKVIRTVSGSVVMEEVQLHQIIARAKTEPDVTATAQALRGLLARHANQDWEVMVPLELLRQRERTKRIFNIVLGSIAAISLLVGGIGIMNIMLASITERTREIGIRRALGAKRRDIVTQFLVETVVLSTTGGLFGILLGIAIPFVVESASGMRTIVTPESLFLSFGISAAVGIIFGLYPAARAAAMNPIEALRRE